MLNVIERYPTGKGKTDQGIHQYSDNSMDEDVRSPPVQPYPKA